MGHTTRTSHAVPSTLSALVGGGLLRWGWAGGGATAGHLDPSGGPPGHRADYGALHRNINKNKGKMATASQRERGGVQQGRHGNSRLRCRPSLAPAFSAAAAPAGAWSPGAWTPLQARRVRRAGAGAPPAAAAAPSARCGPWLRQTPAAPVIMAGVGVRWAFLFCPNPWTAISV